MVDLTKLERFNNPLVDSSSYYEVVNYVADYAQQMLEKLLGNNFSFPLDINSLLGSLQIRIEEDGFCDNEYTIAYLLNDTIHFNRYYHKPDSNISRYAKIQSIAHTIVGGQLFNGKNFAEFTYHSSCYNLYYIANKLALSMVFPWKTTIQYLDEQHFNLKCIDYQAENKFCELCYALKLPKYVVLLAYYNWLEVLDVKRRFYPNDLKIPQYDSLIKNF